MVDRHGDDWEDLIKSDDYQVWLATQPEDYRERATTTPYAKELSKVLDDYKTYAKIFAGRQPPPAPRRSGAQ